MRTMSDKYSTNTQELENINSELFNSFDPEQELWIIGGSGQLCYTGHSTFSNGHYDSGTDYDWAW